MKRTGLLIAIVILLFALSIIGCLYVMRSSEDAVIADIYQNEKLVETIDLSTVTRTYTISLTGEHGEENVILVEPYNISMQSASCPDKLCVKQGKISGSGLPVICLPNHVRISVRTREGEDFDIQVY